VSTLDDASLIDAVDRSQMLAAIGAAADHWRDGAARARAVSLEHIPDHSRLTNVVVCGMGGSGIAGDVVALAAAESGSLPVTVVKGSSLPSYTGPHTLVLMVSYSGDTAETLSCFEQAHAIGSQMIAIATGGRLAEMASAHAFPHVAVAAGMQPRAAFGYLAGAALAVCERLGVIGDMTADLVEADELLREQAAACAPPSATAANPAKTIADALQGVLPVVWGQEGPLAVAAARWKTQLNENAKVPAYASSFSELDHNEIVGIGPGSPRGESLAIVALRSAVEDARMTLRIDATLKVAREAGCRVVEAAVRGATTIGRLAAAAQLGDFVSTYLAVLRSVDPTPVEAIARLKAELA